MVQHLSYVAFNLACHLDDLAPKTCQVIPSVKTFVLREFQGCRPNPASLQERHLTELSGTCSQGERAKRSSHSHEKNSSGTQQSFIKVVYVCWEMADNLLCDKGKKLGRIEGARYSACVGCWPDFLRNQ